MGKEVPSFLEDETAEEGSLPRDQTRDYSASFPIPRRSPRIAVLPFGYEGTVSYGRGTSEGPRAILEASHFVEFYDEILEDEPRRLGIATESPPPIPTDPAEAIQGIAEATERIARQGRFPVVLGGEHSISFGVYQGLARVHGAIGVIQFDAHADLREEYEGTPFSHASVMARIREKTDAVLQLGIRSLSREEAETIRQRQYAIGWMHAIRSGHFDLDAALERLPEKIFLTFDVDALDLALVRSTGTPEPGGFTWDEITSLLQRICCQKHLVGFDMVELSSGDDASAFTVARLTYRLMGFAWLSRYGFDASG